MEKKNESIRDRIIRAYGLSDDQAERLEVRVVSVGKVELRNGDGEGMKIAGYSALFNKESEDLGYFIEKIAPGAFKRALKRSDARALFNHDPNLILGKQSAGTLVLREDDVGLYMENEPPDTSYARDLMVSIERGDIDQQSFAFTVKEDKWEDLDEYTAKRTLIEIDELFDVSPVTFPAYPDTTVGLRSKGKASEIAKPPGSPEGESGVDYFKRYSNREGE